MIELTNETATHEDEYRWHVVGVSKTRESVLKRSLTSMIGLAGNPILEVYVPTEVVRKWKNNKQIEEEKPVMSYLFVLSRDGFLENRDSRIKIDIKYTVIGIVSHEEVAKMKVDFANTPTVVDFDLKVGTKVNIVKGNFVGLNGQIQDIGQDGYITVRIWLMQGCEPTDIKVQVDELSPVT